MNNKTQQVKDKPKESEKLEVFARHWEIGESGQLKKFKEMEVVPKRGKPNLSQLPMIHRTLRNRRMKTRPNNKRTEKIL